MWSWTSEKRTDIYVVLEVGPGTVVLGLTLHISKPIAFRVIEN